MTADNADCTRCGLPLDADNTTGLCLECKHILRDAVVGYTAVEIPIEHARANFMDVFQGHFRRADAADAVYTRGACRRCGRYRARFDTKRCEWCGGPRRFPPKRSSKRTSVSIRRPS